MFPDRLRALRKGQHLTLNQLAKCLNQQDPDHQHPNTSAQMDNWERGIRSPSYLEIERLAQFFKVSMDYLVGREPQDHCDLANLLITDRKLEFNDHLLNHHDRTEIYALIRGYLIGKQNRSTVQHPTKNQQQQKLNLNFKP